MSVRRLIRCSRLDGYGRRMGSLNASPRRARTERGWLIDVALALVTSVVGVLSILTQTLAPGMHEPDAFCVLMAVVPARRSSVGVATPSALWSLAACSSLSR